MCEPMITPPPPPNSTNSNTFFIKIYTFLKILLNFFKIKNKAYFPYIYIYVDVAWSPSLSVLSRILINIHELSVVPSYLRSESTAQRAEKHKHDFLRSSGSSIIYFLLLRHLVKQVKFNRDHSRSAEICCRVYACLSFRCLTLYCHSDVRWQWIPEMLMLMSCRLCCGVWTPSSPHTRDSTSLTSYRWKSPDKYLVTLV